MGETNNQGAPYKGEPTDDVSRTLIWDRVTRLWHWGLVLTITGSWLTAEFGQFTLHRTFGITAAALVVFRLYWGIVGTSTSRFAAFIVSPATTLRYARNLFSPSYKRVAGHNPLGGLSVVALILVLGTQTLTGLFAVDTDGLASGPLARFVSYDLGRQAAGLHEISFRALYVLIGLHLFAIAFYRFGKRIDLISPMVTGHIQGMHPPAKKSGMLALLIGVLIASAVWTLLFRLA